MTKVKDQPDRRKSTRRATPVPVLANEVTHLTTALAAHVAETALFRREVRDEFASLRSEIREEIKALRERNKLVDDQLARYKGALGLLALIGSAIAVAATIIIPYFKN